MKLETIQKALFAAYDIRNAMTDADMKRPTEGESMGECLALVIGTLENLEAEIERQHKVIKIGRFDIVYQWVFGMGRFYGSDFSWEEVAPDMFDDSPEEKHLDKLKDTIDCDRYEEEYINALIAALESNPFTTEETTNA